MNVLIVGLGLMGGAYAYKLKNKGYYVYGVDIDNKAIEYAMNNDFIDEGSNDPSSFISKSDIIVLAFYPKAIIDFLKKYNKLFNEKLIITDICGVKSSFLGEAVECAKPATYLSHHPMAGREKNGIEYSKKCVFEGANFLIVPDGEVKDSAIDVITRMGLDLGFAKISVIDKEKHDNMIGFTSQLTHAIAVSLVNSDKNVDTKKYIGDSYRDLTRIAQINENLWSELFVENKEFLLNHIEQFEHELDTLKNALKDSDKEKLKELFRSSTKIRKEMEK